MSRSGFGNPLAGFSASSMHYSNAAKSAASGTIPARSSNDMAWPAKSTRSTFDEDVTVLVGAEEKRLSVHKKIICEASDFFRAACNGDRKENREKAVKLPEVKPETFGVYLSDLYTGDVDVVDEVLKTQTCVTTYDKDMISGPYRDTIIRLIDSFVLGDILQGVTSGNAIVNE